MNQKFILTSQQTKWTTILVFSHYKSFLLTVHFVSSQLSPRIHSSSSSSSFASSFGGEAFVGESLAGGYRTFALATSTHLRVDLGFSHGLGHGHGLGFGYSQGLGFWHVLQVLHLLQVLQVGWGRATLMIYLLPSSLSLTDSTFA